MDRAPAALHTDAALASDEVPLVVDLDGTLVHTDTLVESMFAAARAHPLVLLRVPLWLLGGRAHLKRKLALRSAFDTDRLPVDGDLLHHLRAEKSRSRRLVLATGADEQIAHAVVDPLRLFDEVLASDGHVNLAGARKRERLVAEFGDRGYDYVGNSTRDLPVWSAARRALLVAPTAALTAAASHVTEIERVFPGTGRRLTGYLDAMRMRHWVKNVLVLVPLVAAHSLYRPAMLADALLAALCFSLAAAGVYLLNDLLDLRADRGHPHKRHRALASGRVPLTHALLLFPGLWLAAALLGLRLPLPFLAVLGTYVVLMIAYSMRLKDIAMVDAFVLACGYTLRIQAGALALQLAVSPWLLSSSMALFFGLALLKRYAELVMLGINAGRAIPARAYQPGDARRIAALGIASGCIAVALLALYPVSGVPDEHARWPVWTVCALLLFWTGHMWRMAQLGRIHDEPVSFALRDTFSRACGVATLAVLLVVM
jgi:4-hydroxybenzoate polyprenyltransferase